MEIHWRHPNAIPLQDQRETEERIEALASKHRDLIDVWVDVDKSAHHRLGSDRVTIRCMARKAEIVVEGVDDEPRAALNKALDAFERDVHRMRERRIDRRTWTPSSPPELGVIDRLFVDEGYGFIVTEGGLQVYFHRNALHDGLDLAGLEVGQQVALGIEEGDKGPQATVVQKPPPGIPEV